MASSDWRSSLGFSARLLAVTKISSAYQSSNPALSAADARSEATIDETNIYDEAQSLVSSPPRGCWPWLYNTSAGRL
ncbi:hypothetical protein ACJQWK_07055 [Exserohilum turcicum]